MLYRFKSLTNQISVVWEQSSTLGIYWPTKSLYPLLHAHNHWVTTQLITEFGPVTTTRDVHVFVINVLPATTSNWLQQKKLLHELTEMVYIYIYIFCSVLLLTSLLVISKYKLQSSCCKCKVRRGLTNLMVQNLYINILKVV